MLLVLLLPAVIAVAQPTNVDDENVIDLQEQLQKVEESYRDFEQNIKALGSEVTSKIKFVVENVNSNALRSDANDKLILKMLNDSALRSEANANANTERANANADANTQIAKEIANNNTKMVIENVKRVEDSMKQIIANDIVNTKQVTDRLQENSDVLKQILETLGIFKQINIVVNITKASDSTPTTRTTPLLIAMQDCSDIYNTGVRESGTQLITLSETEDSFMVYCDMETEGGGWTVFQRRGDYGLPKNYFNKNWRDYKDGFGDLKKEFWLGNEHLSALTKQKNYVLRVDLRDMDGNHAYAKYSHFEVQNEQQLYKLSISGYSGTAGDSMATKTASGIGDMNNMAFSTRDRDNDKGDDCVTWMGGGGWWYNDCTWANLNGPNLQGTTSTHKSMFWQHWKNNWYSVGLAEMKIRPRNF